MALAQRRARAHPAVTCVKSPVNCNAHTLASVGGPTGGPPNGQSSVYVFFVTGRVNRNGQKKTS